MPIIASVALAIALFHFHSLKDAEISVASARNWLSLTVPVDVCIVLQWEHKNSASVICLTSTAICSLIEFIRAESNAFALKLLKQLSLSPSNQVQLFSSTFLHNSTKCYAVPIRMCISSVYLNNLIYYTKNK